MKRFGLIGHPIAHSLSPVLFTAAYGGRYPYELIEESDFATAWKRFLEGYDGVNVTAPFKELAAAMDLLPYDEVSLTGATNLVVKTPLGLEAYNSDYRAVLRIIRDEERRRPLKKLLVVGCGGAAKAAAAAAYMLEKEVVIANRSRGKAEEFASRLEMLALARPCSAQGSVSVCGIDSLPECDMCIYCLPLAIPALESLSCGVFMEANYRDPACSEEFFERNGRKTVYISGEKWLLMQAVTGYALFTGEPADTEAMVQAISRRY